MRVASLLDPSPRASRASLASRASRVCLPAAIAAVLVLGASACDKDDASSSKATSAASGAASTPPPVPEPAPPPSKPQLAVDDTGASVGSDRVHFISPDTKGRLAVALAGKPVAGEELVLDAARNTKVQKVTTLFAALADAKVKGVRVRTAKRDGTQAEIPFAVGGRLPDCAGVGYIGKDLAIRAWPAGGGVGARFSKGMAGPDNTLGSAGIRKVIDKCDAPTWGVSADDSVTWGLLVDLVLAVTSGEDAGPPKATDLVLLPTTVVPGRKIDGEP